MKKIVVLIFILISALAIGQNRTVKVGYLKKLKGITEFNLVFDYSNLKVDKFDTEEEFLADKMKKREKNETDEKFKASWFADRENRYEPKFIESFNKRFRKGKIKVEKGLTSAKYTMKVKTTWIYPGYNVGVVSQPAKINTTISVYETSNPEAIILVVDYDKTLGAGAMGMDFNSGYRISEAYAKLAKTLAADVKKGSK